MVAAERVISIVMAVEVTCAYARAAETWVNAPDVMSARVMAMKTTMSDTGLQIGRRIKARRIAEAIRALGGGEHEARQFSDHEWLLADQVSRQRTGRGHPRRGQPDHPPSPETRALVLEYLSQPEAPTVDPGEPRDEDVPNR